MQKALAALPAALQLSACLPLQSQAVAQATDRAAPYTGPRPAAEHQAGAQDVPAALPACLNCLRAIWALAEHYNTPERLTGLLRRLAGDAIRRCSAFIPLADILDGNVEAGLIILQQACPTSRARGFCCNEQRICALSPNLPNCVS